MSVPIPKITPLSGARTDTPLLVSVRREIGNQVDVSLPAIYEDENNSIVAVTMDPADSPKRIFWGRTLPPILPAGTSGTGASSQKLWGPYKTFAQAVAPNAWQETNSPEPVSPRNPTAYVQYLNCGKHVQPYPVYRKGGEKPTATTRITLGMIVAIAIVRLDRSVGADKPPVSVQFGYWTGGTTGETEPSLFTDILPGGEDLHWITDKPIAVYNDSGSNNILPMWFSDPGNSVWVHPMYMPCGDISNVGAPAMFFRSATEVQPYSDAIGQYSSGAFPPFVSRPMWADHYNWTEEALRRLTA